MEECTDAFENDDVTTDSTPRLVIESVRSIAGAVAPQAGSNRPANGPVPRPRQRRQAAFATLAAERRARWEERRQMEEERATELRQYRESTQQFRQELLAIFRSIADKM